MNPPSLEKLDPQVRKEALSVVNTYPVPEKEIRMRGVECLRVPGRELGAGAEGGE